MAYADDRVKTFRQLHADPGCFIIPNPWDAGSARILELLGFKALATTSYGKQPRVRLSGETASSLSLTNGARVKVTQAGQTTRATVAVDNRVPPGSVRIPLATEVSAALGNASATVTLEAV